MEQGETGAQALGPPVQNEAQSILFPLFLPSLSLAYEPETCAADSPLPLNAYTALAKHIPLLARFAQA